MLQALRLERDDGQLQRADALDRRRGRARFPDQHDVGPQRQQALQIDAECVADARDGARRVGMIAVFDGRDDAIARAGGERELGEMRSETDDALRGRGGVRRSCAMSDQQKQSG